jgi:hypothetical protein
MAASASLRFLQQWAIYWIIQPLSGVKWSFKIKMSVAYNERKKQNTAIIQGNGPSK